MLFDFAVYDKHGQLAVVVEAKSRSGTSRAWAEHWRRGTPVATAHFILLMAKDRTYVWHGRHGKTIELDTAKLLGPVLQRARVDLQSLDPWTFELLVGSWLSDVATAAGEPAAYSELLALGVVDAMRGGQVMHEVAA